MTDARIFVKAIGVNVTQNYVNANSLTKHFLPYRPDLENKKITALSLGRYDQDARGQYLTLYDKNKNVLLSQYPVMDLALGIFDNPFNFHPQRLRLFDLNNISTGDSYIEIAYALVYPAINTTIANLIFYTD